MKLKLNQNFGKYDANEIEKIDSDLEIELLYEKPPNAVIFATISNGEKVIKRKLDNNYIYIEKEFLRIGSLKINIEVQLNGIILKKFSCEDLIVFEKNNKIEAVPEIDSLNQKFENLKIDVDKLTKLVSGLYQIKIKENDNV